MSDNRERTMADTSGRLDAAVRRCAEVSRYNPDPDDWREPVRAWWSAGEDLDVLVQFAGDGGDPRFTEALISLRNTYDREHLNG